MLKCTVATQMLAYGTPAHMWDEYFQIAETTVIECINTFCRGIIENFGPTYIRKPTREDFQCLLHLGEARSFPGMLENCILHALAMEKLSECMEGTVYPWRSHRTHCHARSGCLS